MYDIYDKMRDDAALRDCEERWLTDDRDVDEMGDYPDDDEYYEDDDEDYYPYDTTREAYD